MSTDLEAQLRGQRIRLVVVVLLVAAAITGIAVSGDWGQPQPVLSEVVASNATTLADADGDHPDWIELHNPSGQPYDLTGYHLSDDDGDPARWAFPELTLEPDERVVVFASGKDRRSPGGELHTDFRIAQGEEPVLLVAPDGSTVVDRLPPLAVPPDASVGRAPDDPQRLCFFAVVAPAAANRSACFDGPDLGAPVFSAGSGFFTEPFELSIEAHDPDADIIYTLDGSYPDLEANAERTLTYDGPIRITDRTGGTPALATIVTVVTDEALENFSHRDPPDLEDEVLEQATVVRARSPDSAETAATFFVGEDRVREHLPVISLAMDSEYLFDHDMGIYVAGRTFEDWRNSDEFDPEISWDFPTNYNQRGRAWERPPPDDLRRAVLFEHCEPGGACAYQRQVGVRVHGRFSRGHAQKSLRLYARADYGDPRFNAPLFGDDGPVGHRRVLLRNSGNDNARLMFVDAYLQSLMGDLEADTQAYEPAVLFINGEYWGIHNLRERYDRHYLEVVHGADPDAVEILDNTSGPLEGNTPGLVADWERFVADVDDLDPSERAFVETLESALDVDSFYDALIGHIFVANSDWVSNNMRWWRQPDGPDQLGQGARDGRWRWLINDLDHMGRRAGNFDADYDPLSERLAPTDSPERHDGLPFLFERMMANDELRARFVTRFADHLNTSFRPWRTLEELGAVRARLGDEMGRHVERWQTLSMDKWHGYADDLAEFMRERPAVQREHLQERLDLDDLARLVVTHDHDKGRVRVNTIDLDADTPGVTDPEHWAGGYFQDVPVTLEAIPREGYRFVRWQGAPEPHPGGPTITFTLDGDRTVEPVFTEE